jgi:hypothetical protein
MMPYVWLSDQAVARLTELLDVVAAAPDASDVGREELEHSRSQVGELMPAIEVVVLAGILREATDRPGLSATVRADCWSWSSYLAHLLVSSPTATATTTQLVPWARPARNGVLISIVDGDRTGSRSRLPQRLAVELR